MIRNGHIIISQSMSKELGVLVIDDQVEHVDTCYKRFAEKYFYDRYEYTPSLPMLKGLYAETKLLGSCARGESVDDLPRKSNGEKTASQVRIDKQVERMHGFMASYGVKLTKLNTQVRLLAPYAPKIWLRGEFDVFPARVGGRLSIVDFKTTKDVNNSFFSIAPKYVSFAPHGCWGNYDKLAKNQPLFYHHIARYFHLSGLDMLKRFNPNGADQYDMLFKHNLDFSDVDFFFFVAGIDKSDIEGQLKLFEYSYTPHRQILLRTLVDATVARIIDAVKHDFPANPKPHLCASCALKEVCSSCIDSGVLESNAETSV